MPIFASNPMVQRTGAVPGTKNKSVMIAYFLYNIPRHHGKYGTGVAVYNNRESRKNGEMRVELLKTYKHQTEYGVDFDAQIEELKSRVSKKYPGIEFAE